ncbi:MAG: anthranilate phosphoribosyltransferase [Bacteroidia bacterium]|nr:anthranilate phosphoribosyltransferase [Bacteroidia bacterium]
MRITNHQKLDKSHAMKNALEILLDYQTLDSRDAENLMADIAERKFPPAQLSALLTGFIMRGITCDELKAFRNVLMEKCVKVDLGTKEVMDVCGTGGDSKNTFNISTLTAFVLAGAGIPVAKHGNYSVTSVSGSSTVLECMGIKFSSESYLLRMQLEECGICFMHAPLFHPALKSVANVRKELKVKTFFNMLGPLINPAMPKYRFHGVYSLGLARMYHFLFEEEPVEYYVYHSLDGHDEISLTCDFKFFTNREEGLISPLDLGLTYLNENEIKGGKTKEESAEIFLKILKGQGTKPQNEVIVTNAALAVRLFKKCTFEKAVGIAQDSLFNLKALECFEKLKRITYEHS